MAFKVIDQLVLVAYGAADPSEEEWAEYLAALMCQGIEKITLLISTEGGEPTSRQRRQLDALFAGRAVPVAILTRSVRVWGTVTVLSWFGNTKAFPPSGLRDALAYLEIPSNRADHIEAELRKLRREVDQGPRDLATELPGDVIDRLDVLAARLGLKRPQVLAQLVRTGLDVVEARASVPRIAVTITPGTFTSERFVTFMASERSFEFVVDQADVNEGESTMRVEVLQTREGEVLVRFPRPPEQGPASTWLPRSMVLGLL